MCPPANDKILASAQGRSITEESIAQDLEIAEIIDTTDTLGKRHKIENPNLSTRQVFKTPDAGCNQEIFWYLEFDGSVNKLGAGAGVWIHNMQNYHAEGHAYRLNFRCTNNMAEYEALLLGLKLIKSLGAARISILADFDLVIQQMKGNFVINDLRLRAYRGAAIGILNTFLKTQLNKISRNHNLHAHILATFASTCKLPFEPNHHFTAEINHRPAVPGNVKNWQVFENDTQINSFLTLKEEFSSTNIDTRTICETDQIDKIEKHISAETANQTLHPTIFTSKNL